MTPPGNRRIFVALLAATCLLPALLAYSSGDPWVGGLCAMGFVAVLVDSWWLRRR